MITPTSGNVTFLSRSLLWVLVFVLSFLAVYFVIPLQWDKKSLRTVIAETGSPIEVGSDVVYISQSTVFRSRAVAAYGLDLLSFPRGRDQWLVLEGENLGVFPDPVLVDKNGNFIYRGMVDEKSRKMANKIALNGVLLVETDAVALELRKRWPSSVKAKIVTRLSGRSGIGGFGGKSITLPQILKLVWVCLLYMLVVLVIAVYCRDPILSLGFGFPLLLFSLTSIVYLCGFFSSRPEMVGSIVLSLALIFLLIKKMGIGIDRSNGQLENFFIFKIDFTPNKMPAYVLLIGLVSYLVFVALRLDFDGDLFTHWLPAARSHYYLGHHDIGFLLNRYGGAHETTYPPGFPIFLSILMWVSHMDPARSMQMGMETNFMAFLYRIFFGMFYLGFLAATARVFGQSQRRKGGYSWVVAPLMLFWFQPFLSGGPMSAEILFVPCVGFAVLGYIQAINSDDFSWINIGVTLTAFLLFIKNDSILIIPFIVFPWAILAIARFGIVDIWNKVRNPIALVLGVSVFPYFVWKFSFLSYEINQNFMFNSVSFPLQSDQIIALKNIYANFLKTIIDNGSWILFFCFLPLATILSFSGFGERSKISNLARISIPLGIFAYFCGIPIIYIFSRSDAINHFDTSFYRLSLSATVGAIMFICYLFLNTDLGEKQDESTKS